jgi:hypothetical protein
MADGSTLQLQFDADEWDSLISFEPGPVELGGELELSFAEDVDVSTQVGRTLRLFDWSGVSPNGQFELDSAYPWDLSNLYRTGEVTFLVLPTLPDYDGSGLVDQGDLDLAAAGWMGNLPDGAVDQGELDRLLLNWGSAASAFATSSVPEPSAAAILVMGVIAFAGRRRLFSIRFVAHKGTTK